MPRQVLILTSEDPEHPGGMESFVSELLRGFKDRGYAVRVLHKGNCLPGALSSPSGRVKRAVSDAALGWYIGRQVESYLSKDVAAIISNSIVGWHLPASRSGNPRRIHFFHGTYRGQADAIAPHITPFGKWKLKWWDSMFLERLSGKGKLVLCNSEQTAEEVHRFFGLDTVNVWLPLDISHFRPMDQEECRRLLGLSQTGKIGLFVGSFSPMKNFAMVRSLISALPDVQWILAMRGDVPRRLETEFRGLLRQNVQTAELPILYNAADFSVCPSFYEPFGYVVAESLACGTPVIASVGGASRAFLDRHPFEQFLIGNPLSVPQFLDAAREMLRAPGFYRQKVWEIIRPRLIELMAPENWWRRFCDVTGL